MARPSRYKGGVPSVTGIVDIIDKPGLRYWYGSKGTQECERIKKSSQNIGHGVHAGIEKFLRGKPESECGEGMTDDQKVMLSHLTDWCREKKIKPISMEEPLYSDKYQFAGTPDVICTFNGGKTVSLVDWKTDSTPRAKADDRERAAKYLWQMAGYAIAYQEQFNVTINKAYIVRASKDLKFAEYYFNDLKEGKKEFKMLRAIYKRIKGK